MSEAELTEAHTDTTRVEVARAIREACARIAPSWPLDRLIAVNPFWSEIGRPLSEVSAERGALSGTRLLMPRAWFREQYRHGRFDDRHLARALALSGSATTLSHLLRVLEDDEPSPPRRLQLLDVAELECDLVHRMSLRELMTHSMSQLCASFFDDGQAQHAPPHGQGLYESFRTLAAHDESPALLVGLDRYTELARALPPTAEAMIHLALAELKIAVAQTESYLFGLLLDVQGWASLCAYRHWTARLRGGEDDSIRELLAIRIAWEWLLLRTAGPSVAARWQLAMRTWPAVDGQIAAAQADDFVLQRALELGYQERLTQDLLARDASQPTRATAAVQAVFCIDVRSEPVRRALESERADVQTLGFAGFFGMPVEYQPLGTTEARPQLPGLLAPRFRITDTQAPDGVGDTRRVRLGLGRAWQAFKTGPISSFSFVESLGVFSAASLFGEAFALNRATPRDSAGLGPRVQPKPRLTETLSGEPLSRDERCELAFGMLCAMSLRKDFARLVVLVGHGSETRNNPQAAGLDCGACCGQTGEVNARAAAALLNEPAVREGLVERGIVIPQTTHFMPALHITTTDEVRLFDLDEVPESHTSDVAELQHTLERASESARAERARRFGLSAEGKSARRALALRARDWAQVRPEWGLVDNAALIVARREHVKHVHLAGRAFLHDYRFEDDEGFAILELIMTAPMVVSHWINLQYYASTVDNLRYGSGNKLLHNVVGGHLGVFEGNGGDLRVGLSLQSLHDGERWVHTPLRLSVFIEAPRSAIDGVLRKHATVRSLVDNEWLYLFQYDADENEVRAYRNGRWCEPWPDIAASAPRA